MTDKPIEAEPVTVRDAVAAIDRLPEPTPLELIHHAVKNGAQVDVMEKLLGLQERWERNIGRKAFDAAIAKAKAEIPIIRKGNLVDFTTSRGRTSYAYEDLATIAQTIDPILSKYGLSYRWRPNSDAKTVTVTCILSHSAGHSEENTLCAPHDLSGNKNSIQAVGSAVTYLQRYTLKAALGLAAAADDDARALSRAPEEKPVIKPSILKNENTETVCPSVEVLQVRERTGTKRDGKPWTAWFVLLDDGVGKLEAGTFSKSIGDLAKQLSDTHEKASATIRPSAKQAGKFELVSLARAEQPPAAKPDADVVPMDFDDKGQPIEETIP